jgi:hypothetical protein
VQKTYKKKGEILSSPSAPSVIDRSIADVSFLAGMVVDKVMFYLPLYRATPKTDTGGSPPAKSNLNKALYQSRRAYRDNLFLFSLSLKRERIKAQIGRYYHGFRHPLKYVLREPLTLLS